jgi:hypothetical protein
MEAAGVAAMVALPEAVVVEAAAEAAEAVAVEAAEAAEAEAVEEVAAAEAEVAEVEVVVVEAAVVEEVEEVEVEVVAAGAEAAEGIRHQKAPDSRDGRSSPRQPAAAEQRETESANGRRPARASGRAGLASQDEQRPSPEVACRSWQSWAAAQQVPPALAGRPRPPDCPAARMRHARSSRRSKPSLRARARAASF